MNVLVISGRTARQPWTSGGLVAASCGALVRRGHRVMLAAQSVDDPAMFAACDSVRTFSTFDQTATDWPLGFAAWARGERRAGTHDVCLSFSRVAPGDVWMPLEPGGAAWLARARRSLSVHSLGIAVGRHHGALRAWASDLLFVSPPPWGGEPIRRVLAVGAVSAGEASRLLHRVQGLGERVVKADSFAMYDPPRPDELAELRARTRALLGIEPATRVVLASCNGPVGRLLDPLFAAAADLGARDPSHGPLVLALAKDCFALHHRAVRLGATSHVRVQSLTARLDAMLAASDAVALPIPGPRGVFASGGMGRLGAEALRFGRPVLALSGAPGYGLARLRSSGEDAPGLVVDASTLEDWTRALRQMMDDGWLERSAAATRELGAAMTFDRFAGTLEGVLNDAAIERAEDRSRH